MVYGFAATQQPDISHCFTGRPTHTVRLVLCGFRWSEWLQTTSIIEVKVRFS